LIEKDIGQVLNALPLVVEQKQRSCAATTSSSIDLDDAPSGALLDQRRMACSTNGGFK
jgi:hypothetical protein